MRPLAIVAIIALANLTPPQAFGADGGPLDGFKIKGTTYFDLFAPLTEEGPRTMGEISAFEFRRAYFTVEHTLNDEFAVRFRTDADRKADDKFRPFIKHLYMSWAGIVPNAKIYVGISGTPTWSSFAEKYWGYRGVDKTMLDAFKGVTGTSIDVTSAAAGVALKGTVADKLLGYHVFFSNGEGYSHPEEDKYKKLMFQGSVKPVDGAVLVGLVELEPQDSDNNNTLLKGFAGYKSGGAAVGAEYFVYTRGGVDNKSSGLSVFGRYDVQDNVTPFVRLDMYEPDSETDEDETSLVIAGIDFRPHSKVHVMPNVHYFINPGAAEADLIATLTFQYGL